MESPLFLSLHNSIDYSILHSFCSTHIIIPVCILCYSIQGLSCSLRKYSVNSFPDFNDFLCLYSDILSLSLSSTQWLMNHDVRIGQRKPLALCSGCQQECSHASCSTNTYGSDIRLDILNRVIYCKSSTYRSTWAVNINLNILFRIISLKKQQLSHYKVSHHIIDF